MGRTGAVEALVEGGVESDGRRKGDARAIRTLFVLKAVVARLFRWLWDCAY
jgi:hypothetical protein